MLVFHSKTRGKGREEKILTDNLTAGNTYAAGCTDPSFTSPECLHKPPPFHDQEWVAINQACKNLNGNAQTTNVTNWTGCRWDDHSVDLVKLPLASCTPYCSQEHVLYAGSSSLQAYASLPVLSGSSIFWQNNYVPPATPAAGYTPGTPTGVVGTFTPTATSPISPDTLTNTGLSTSAKIGIGVGAGVGGILLIAILVSLFVCCVRRRERRNPAQLDGTQIHPSSPPPNGNSSQYNAGHQSSYSYSSNYAPVPSSSPKLYNTSPYSGAGGIPNELDNNTPSTAHDYANSGVGPYTGYKTELPADNIHHHHSSMNTNMSERLSVPLVYQSTGTDHASFNGNANANAGTNGNGGLQPVAPGSSPPLSSVSTALASSPSTTEGAGRYNHSPSHGHSLSHGHSTSHSHSNSHSLSFGHGRSLSHGQNQNPSSSPGLAAGVGTGVGVGGVGGGSGLGLGYTPSHAGSHTGSFSGSHRVGSPQFVEGVGDTQVPYPSMNMQPGYGGGGGVGVGHPGQPYYGHSHSHSHGERT